MFTTLAESFSASDALGKLIFLMLWLLSLLCWWVIFAKARLLHKLEKFKISFDRAYAANRSRWVDWVPSLHLSESGVEQTLESGRTYSGGSEADIYSAMYRSLVSRLRALLSKNQNLIGRISLSMEDLEMVDYHTDSVIDQLIESSRRHLNILLVATTLAPFLGLLGTVWGMLSSFQHMRSGGSASLSNEYVIDGLSMALATTVLGLIVAIPALIAYHGVSYYISGHHRQLRRLKADVIDMAQFTYRMPVEALKPSASIDERLSRSGVRE